MPSVVVDGAAVVSVLLLALSSSIATARGRGERECDDQTGGKALAWFC